MKPRLIAKFSEVTKQDVMLAGGKGASLGELTQAGLPVPGGFIVTTYAFKQFRGEIPASLHTVLLKAFDELGSNRVAVRSSAVAEDSLTDSWAGQFESYLNVGRSGLVSAVKKCWQSLQNGQAYASAKDAGSEGLVMAVVVQAMVDCEVSGVAFTVNPVTKAEDEMMIEAIYGLGELLVQGMITPDNYRVSKNDFRSLERRVAPKRTMLVYDGRANRELPVPEAKVDEACLDEAEIQALSEILVQIEKHYAAPQDVEWGMAHGQFMLLQSRPITA